VLACSPGITNDSRDVPGVPFDQPVNLILSSAPPQLGHFSLTMLSFVAPSLSE
jgi:hypothetical protein